MFTLDDFIYLLGQGEGQQLDFKRDPYRLTEEEGRADFIKDVLAMANTPREGNSYIVLGVKANADGSKDLVGLSQALDDNEYQSAIKVKVHPCPSLLYVPITHEGKNFGVIVIRPERRGPYQATLDVGKKLRRYVIYWRRGSTIDEARVDEQELIRDWCAGRSQEQQAIEGSDHPQSPWDRLVAGCHTFESERVYILIAGPIQREMASRLGDLGLASWNLVLDFDADSADSGLGAATHGTLRQSRALHEVTLGDRPSIRAEGACYWYYARGLTRRPNTVSELGWMKWKQKYGLDLQEQLRSLAAARSSRPTTVIAAWDAEDFIDTVFSGAVDMFGETVDFVVAHPSASRLTRLRDRYDATLVDIDLHHIAEGLGNAFHNVGESAGNEVIQLPSKSGVRVAVNREDQRYLEEDLEIVGLTAGTVADRDREACLAFFRGKQITWFELGLHCDVDREKTERILKAVQLDLGGGPDRRSRGTTRINLYHAPGAGGSTVGRRIIWNLHAEFPCVVVHRTVPAETAERLQLVYRLTGLPLLVLLEGAEVQENQADDLYSILRARQVSGVLLQVLRRFSGVEERDRSFYLPSPLSHVEATRFAHRLGEARPNRRARVLSLASDGSVEERTAFYFGLETFEDQFEGLRRYVSLRLEHATEEQRLILAYLSFAYHYGQQSVAATAFAKILALPKTRQINIENALPGTLLDLVRRQADNRWRASHDLVAQEVLHQLLAPNSADDRVWRQNLSVWASRFAEFCRGDDVVPSDDMVDLASRCFLFRDNRDPLGRESPDLQAPSHFAQLIEDIPVVEGRLTVLKNLTALFPDQAHFWGHLGRFYAMQLRDSENALVAIDRAIELNPEDGTLYHMKGMALRSRLYSLMKDLPAAQSRGELDQVVDLSVKAAEQFAIARDKHPTEEHGYISHIQMLLRVLDFARVATGTESTQRLLISPTIPPALRESLDTAEDLLEQARKLREGERPSSHVERCRVQIDALYGKFDVVLQGWNSLLTRQDVYRPPIRRQLVQAYVVRRGRRWDALDTREMNRVVELLDQNLLEEPNDPRNLRLWMQAVRRMQPPIALDSVIERVSYWRANSTEIEAVYYLYILHALRALQGFALAVDPMKECLEDCRRKARLRPNRTGSLEWIGPGHGLGQLVHYSELGGWSTENDFWARGDLLVRLNGTIISISGPEAGVIEMPSGVRAFFVPGKSGHSKGRDENRGVSFYLGFSYDGPRAWEVRSA